MGLIRCNTLQHTATHCNTLQHTATHCNTLQHTATHDSLQSTAKHSSTRPFGIYPPVPSRKLCNTLQHTATHCHTPQHTATHRNTPQRTATHRNTPQHTATHHNTTHHTTHIHSHKLCNPRSSRPSPRTRKVCVAVCCSVLQCAAVCCSVNAPPHEPVRVSLPTNLCLYHCPASWCHTNFTKVSSVAILNVQLQYSHFVAYGNSAVSPFYNVRQYLKYQQYTHLTMYICSTMYGNSAVSPFYTVRKLLKSQQY